MFCWRVVYLGVLALCTLVAGDLVAKEDLSYRVNNRLGPFSQEWAFEQDHKLDLEYEAATKEIINEVLPRNFIVDIILDILEGFRDVVINGNGVIPTLDPLEIESLGPYQIVPSSGTRVEIKLNGIQATGLRWYVVDSVLFNPIRLSLGVHLTLPWLTITGNYDARAIITLLTHRANGNLRIFLYRLEVGVEARLGTNLADGHLVLRDLNIKLDIHDTGIQINGMTGSALLNSLINSYVQNLTQDIIQEHTVTIADLLSKTLFDIINDFLKDFTIQDILGKQGIK